MGFRFVLQSRKWLFKKQLHRGLKNLFKTTTSEDELSRILCNLGSGDTNEDSAWNALVVFLGMHEDGVYKELNDILINC